MPISDSTNHPATRGKPFRAPGNPASTPGGKQSDTNPTPGNKRDPGMPDGRVADMGRQSSPGPDGPSMPLRVKNQVKGRYHKSGGPRQPS